MTLKKAILQKLKDGVVNASRDNKKIDNEKELKEIADNLVTQTLNYLRVNYALVG
jgi:methyltransferase-like protein